MLNFACSGKCKKIWYVLSKTLAEKAAWKFCEENKIDLVTVLPSFVVGRSLPPELCSTAADVLGLLKGRVLAALSLILVCYLLLIVAYP